MAAANKVSLKLLVDTKAHKVLFAEANKEFVDFLFNLMSLPLGTVIQILSTQSMVGSLGKIYNSIETLNETYKQAPQASLDALLKPAIYTSAAVPLLLPNIQSTNNNTVSAPQKGYVKDVVTYMVMDDLEVRPMSTITGITILNKFNIKDIGVLEEKVVEVGMDKGVELLKVSLQSKAVLTEVFLGKKATTTTVSVNEVD